MPASISYHEKKENKAAQKARLRLLERDIEHISETVTRELLPGTSRLSVYHIDYEISITLTTKYLPSCGKKGADRTRTRTQYVQRLTNTTPFYGVVCFQWKHHQVVSEHVGVQCHVH